MTTPLRDLAGQTRGRWHVLSIAEYKRKPRWLCRCECGTQRVVTASNLHSGKSTSCGCISREMATARAKHGQARTPTYTTWTGMHDRCRRKANKCYRHYGARGITVCDRWSGDTGFENFLADMGTRPAGLSLDRIDNERGYSPENCRWATSTQQTRNTRRTKLTSDLASEVLGRLEHGESTRSIARHMGITDGHVWNIQSGTAWSELPRFAGRP